MLQLMKRYAMRWFSIGILFSFMSVFAPTMLAIAQAATAAPSAAPEYGVWNWTPLSQMSAAQMQAAVNEAAAGGFNVIYTTVDEYLAIDVLPDGVAKNRQVAAYKNSVNEFLTLASAQGIAVDAEAGWRDWAVPGNTWQPYEIMNFVSAYNAAARAAGKPQFRGVQYDIEPYLLPQYGTTAATEKPVLTQYAQLVDGLVRQDKRDGLPLGFDIPSFYTASAGATPQITVDGITNYPYNQILRLLNELPNGRILLMAYRNFAIGANGTIALSNDEVHLADGGRTKMIVGQETGPVTPSYVTFYGLSKSALNTQVGYVNQAFASDGSFKGIAIDYLDYYVQLP